MLGTRAPAIAGDALLSPNRVVVSPHRSVDDFCLGFFDAESVLYNIKSGKYFPFLRKVALKIRNKIRKLK